MSVKDIVLAASGQSTTPPAATFQIERSLRFNSADSTHVKRIPSTVGNRSVWTWSGWVKRSAVGAYQGIFVAYANTTNTSVIDFSDADRIRVVNLNGSSIAKTEKATTAVYRDLSAWYHIVVSSNGSTFLKLYVNGEEVTSFITNVGPTADSWQFNNTIEHRIGHEQYDTGNYYLNGYITEVNFIDGQALTPSSFGEIRSTTGVWSPKQYTGTYGTNGFYLPFNDNSSVLNLGRNRIPFEKDPDWQQTVLLLSGDGNQGANNINNPGPPRYLAFTDNSDNNFPITVNGDAYGDNFSPFMTEAGQWSVNFTGSNYFTVPDSAGLEIGSSNFTIECWFYPTAVGNYAFITKDAPSGTRSYGFIAFNDSGALKTTFFIAGGAQLNSTATLNINAWNFVAVTRSGNTLYISVNGTVNSGSWTSTIPDNAQATVIGAQTGPGPISNFCVGHLSNLRLVIGESVSSYQSNFTPPTSPASQTSGGITASNTKLLVCQSNRFVDNAATPSIITTTNSPLVKPFNPFTTTYSSTNGSGYFDGTGDGLVRAFASTADGMYPQGTTWTIEAWVYPLATNGVRVIYFTTATNTASFGTAGMFIENGALSAQVRPTTGGAAVTISGGSVPVNTWSHCAISVSSGAARLYLNGAQVATGTFAAASFTPTGAGIGYFQNANVDYFQGFISELRLVQGRAVYTSAFTPPTAPLGLTTGGQNPPQGNETSLLTCQYQGSVRNVGFIDSSPYDHVITRNPATGPNAPTQGTFSPFSLAAGEWSNYFDGNADWLGIAYNSAFLMGSSTDFCMEGWIYPTESPADSDAIYSSYPDTTNNNWIVWFRSGKLGVYQYPSSSFTTGAFQSTTTIPINTWTHFAFTRSGSVFRLFINGVQEATVTVSVDFGAANKALEIGRYGSNSTSNFTGYISNLRHVVGRAVYTGNFTPPTAPLGATSGGQNPPQGTETSLLTCQSNRFVDNGVANSGTGFTITRNGDVRVTPFSPFAPTAAYSPSVNGGSGYFDGTGDYLTVTRSTAFIPTTGDFTFEAWVYPNALATAGVFGVWEQNGTAADFVFALNVNGTLDLYVDSNATAYNSDTAKYNALQWNHVMACRSGSTLYVGINGVAKSFASMTANLDDGGIYPLSIGADQNGDEAVFTGYMANVRILKGSAQYAGTTYTVPTAPLTSITNTGLLLNFTNAGIFDQTGKNVLETVGNAQIDTSVKKFGTGSMKFDGNGDYLLIPTNPDIQFGTGDFTIEFWIYPNTTVGSGGDVIFDRRSTANTQGRIISLENDGKIYFYGGDANTSVFEINISTSVLTASQWYHYAVTKSGSTYTCFLDGVLQNSATSSATLADDTSPTRIGAGVNNANYLNGYIDDLRISRVAKYTGNFSVPDAPFALTTVDNNYRQWVPTNFSVTPGAGNDSLVDSPTPYGTDTGVGGEVRGNYCTLNPLDKNTNISTSNGGLEYSRPAQGSNAWNMIRATVGMSSGKWYWEFTTPDTLGSGGIVQMLGIVKADASLSLYVGGSSSGWAYYFDGTKWTNNSGSSYGATWNTNDIIGVAFDADNGTLAFYKNGASQGQAFSGLTSGPYFPAFSLEAMGSTGDGIVNFGQRPFAYTAPSGFKALCTTNLPNPTVVQGDDHFNTVLYTGTGADLPVTGVGFQPDLIWTKARSAVDNNVIVDAIRGIGQILISNSSEAASTYAAFDSFDSDGFTKNITESLSGRTYVAWNWKANGAGVSNTAGSITSTVSANTTAGVSVVTYTGNGSSGATVGHGLGVAPSMIIIKRRSAIENWCTYHASLGATKAIFLNLTDAENASSVFFNNTAPTSGAFSIGTNASVNGNASTYVAYCFAAIPGFSAFGRYTGNGSADGPFVYLGFRPAFVMVKNSTDAGVNWLMWDNKMNAFNVVTTYLLPNSNVAQQTDLLLDMTSNGFKPRVAGGTGINQSGKNYIYMAFAENPFKYALAR